MGWERRGKREHRRRWIKKNAMDERTKGGAEGVSEQRTWCVSTSESALWERVYTLAVDVRACVDGKAGTDVEVDGSAGVRDVVDALRTLNVPNVTATGRGMENRKGARLDVVVVVRAGKKEVARFSGSVEVVPTRRVVMLDTVTIGTGDTAQVWAARNVRAVKYVDGEDITHAPTLSDFVDMTEKGIPAWIYSKDGSDVLFNAHVVLHRLCPPGFRVPKKEDWDKLKQSIWFVPGDMAAAAATLKARTGFAAKLTGCVWGETARDTNFVGAGTEAHWWVDSSSNYYMYGVESHQLHSVKFSGISLRLIAK
jgi:uncharacterized protein (TIGR02145 family)